MPTSFLIGTFFVSLFGILGVFFGQVTKMRSEHLQKIREALGKIPFPSAESAPEESEKTASEMKEVKTADEEGTSDHIPPKEMSGMASEKEGIETGEQPIEEFYSRTTETPEGLQKIEQVEIFTAGQEAETPEEEKISAKHREEENEGLRHITVKELHDYLRKAEVHLARNEYEEAEKLFIKIISFSPKNITALQKLAYLYLQTESYAKAEGLYRELLEVASHNAAIYTNLGLALFNEKKFEDAIAAYQKAVELDPEHAARHANLGQVFFVIKDLESAIICFTEAVKRDPRNVSFLYLLADASLEAKKFAEAKKWYEKILDLSPYDEAAKEEVRRLQALGF